MSFSPQVVGLIIGGFVPAILYAVSAVSQRGSVQLGIAIGIFLFFAGISVMASGILFFFLSPVREWSLRSAGLALLTGLAWGIGTGCVALAVERFGSPMSKLVPLYNMNTLIAVIFVLWIFAEWKQVKVAQLLLGSLFIVIGGTLVAKA